jgi:HEAT repeat protein
MGKKDAEMKELPFQTAEKNPDSGSLENDLSIVYQDMKKQSREVPIYVSFLRDGILIERTRSAEALGEIGDKAAVQPLIDALSDKSTDVQYVAAKSLGLLADVRAVEPLIEKLKSDEKWVRRGSAHALGLIGDKRAVDPLIALLSDPHHDVRAEASWSLGRLGEVRAIEPIQSLLQDTHEVVQKAAAAAVDLLKKNLNPEGQPAASVAMGNRSTQGKPAS